MLPGIYARTHHKSFPAVRVQALQLYEPTAILVEHAAAQLSFWPTIEVEAVTAAVSRKLAPQAGYRFRRRTVPDHLVQEIDGVRMTKAALTAIDLGADAIDVALRTGAATLDDMREALGGHPLAAGERCTPPRAAGVERRSVVDRRAPLPRAAASGRYRGLARQRRGRRDRLHRRRPVPRRAAGDRDRRPRLSRGRQLRARPMASERDRPGRLASAALHLDHDRRVSRAGDRDGPRSSRSASTEVTDAAEFSISISPTTSASSAFTAATILAC